MHYHIFRINEISKKIKIIKNITVHLIPLHTKIHFINIQKMENVRIHLLEFVKLNYEYISNVHFLSFLIRILQSFVIDIILIILILILNLYL